MTIEALMILFILIEMFQVFFILVQIYATRKQLTLILEDPAYTGHIMSNAVHGFMDQLLEDSKDGAKRRENFFGFMQIIGRNIMAGITGGAPGEAKPVKLKGNAKILEPFINNPQIQNMFAGMLADKLQKGVTKKAGEAIDGWL